MDHPAIDIDNPTQIAPLDAILNDLAEDLDGSPATFHDLLQICRGDLGDANVQNITTAMEFFKCVENNKVYDQIEFVDYLINVTDVLNYHTVMGTNRVSNQLAFYKERLQIHREHLRRTGVNTDKNFVGRTEDLDRIIKVLSDCADISCVGVCICGLGGMGKTSIANEVCYRLNKSKQRWKIIRIDLRERVSLLDLLSLTLSELSEVFSSTDIKDMTIKLWKAIANVKRRTILLYDNIDELLQNKQEKSHQVLGFLKQFMEMLEGRKSDVPIKLLITARQKLIPDDNKDQLINQMRRVAKSTKRMDDLLLEIELKKLTAREATSLFEKCVDEKFRRKGDDKMVSDIIGYCGYNPLAIRSTCSAINGGLVEPQVIRYNLKISAEKGGLTYALQVNNCLDQTFNSLSSEFKAKLFRLSVFHTSKFDIQAARAVFGDEETTTGLHLLALKTRHFVEITEDDDFFSFSKSGSGSIDVFSSGASKLKYSLHPLVYMFLQEYLKDENLDFKDELSSARLGFVRHFEQIFCKIGKEMERNCMRAWRLIEKNKPHLMNLLKSDPIPETISDMKDRILLCTQMVLIGNLLVGDFHRIKRIERMLKSCEENGNKLEYLFWKIEKASFFYDLDRNEVVDKYLCEIEEDCNDVVGKGTALAPVFGMFYLLKGKYHLKQMDPKKALLDLEMAQKLFNEHRFVSHRYLYHVTSVYEKIAQAHLMGRRPDEAFVYLSAAFTKGSEKVENFYNLDLPSQIASIGLCSYMKGMMQLEGKNSEQAKIHFDESVRCYKKAMTLDCEMNLHVYDNYADKLVKRAESYLELGRLGVSGAFSEAVRDIKEADDLRRRNLQPPHYKLTHTPHLVGKILLSKGEQEYHKKQKSNALNHIWEGIMYYEITRDMMKCGGLHPLHIHIQEYRDIKAEHLWALQQAREEDKIQDAIKFYKDFEGGRFVENRMKARSERHTVQNSEYIPIEDLKAEMMMSSNTGFIPVQNDGESFQVKEEFDKNMFDGSEFEKLEKSKLLDFDKLFRKFERQEEKVRKRFENPNFVPSASSSSSEEEEEEEEVVAMDTGFKNIKDPESLKDIIHQDIEMATGVHDKSLDLKSDEGFNESKSELSDEKGKNLIESVRRKSSESLSSKDLFLKERREKFKQKRARDHSMQMFLDDIERASEVGKPILKSTRTLSQDKSFDTEMPLIEYLEIIAETDKVKKKKKIEEASGAVGGTDDETKSVTVGGTEDETKSVTVGESRKHKLQRSTAIDDINQKSRRDTDN